ncbi:MAG: carbon-monoxide dehydrogenase medium subunit [Paracoccaceae bacterium]|jgi:carbon-monoxide dehydrogenase medium subunit
MKPPKFDYFAPDSIESALALITEHGDEARFLAGGQSLVPMMNFRVAAPSALIDLNGIAALRGIRIDEAGRLYIGAMTRTREIEMDATIAQANPLLHAAAPNIAHIQIRNRGTIGGSLAHADPAAELPGIVLVCGAEINIVGPGGARSVAAGEFFEGIFSTALNDGDMISEIVFPAWPSARHWAFEEISRREGDFAMVGIATWFDLDDTGRIAAAGLAAIGAGDTPLRLPSGENILIGQTPGGDLFTKAARAAVSDLHPGGDIHASAEYRREVGGVLVERALRSAWERSS